MSIYKNISAIIILLILSLNLFAQKSNDSNSEINDFIYKADDGSFQIEFPAKYKVTKSITKDGLDNLKIKSKRAGDIYIFSKIKHKNSFKKVDKSIMCDASIKAFAKAVNGKIEKSEDVDNGKESVIFLKDKELYVFYRVIIQKKSQYQIMVISSKSKKRAKTKAFFESFSLK